jgi:hypothetical protein
VISNQNYGIIVRNQNTVDSGDSGIIDNMILSSATSAIRFESSGGLRIASNKINVAAVGIQIALASGANTTGIYIVGNSIEGVTGDAINAVRQGSTGAFHGIIISDNEFAGNTCCLNIPTDANGTWLTLVNFTGGVYYAPAAGACVLAKINSTIGFCVAHVSFQLGTGTATNQIFQVGATSSQGVLGPINALGTPGIASVISSAATTLYAPT